MRASGRRVIHSPVVPPSPAEQRTTVTRLIRGLSSGEPDAAGALLEVVYDELRALAGAHFRHEQAGHTLQPTALVHEAYIRLLDEDHAGERGKREFFAAASRAMRRVLIDHARARKRLKRGGGRPDQLLVDPKADPALGPLELIALDEALDELETHDERKARLVELRYFGGLTLVQACEMLDISRATGDREWRVARAWLAARLGGESAE